MVGGLMALAAPTNKLAELYASLGAKGQNPDGRSPIERRKRCARDLLENSTKLVDLFRSSVGETSDYFAENDPGESPFYGTPRSELARKPGLSDTAAVGALMEKQGRICWDVFGDKNLSFYYIDRELLVTQAKKLRSPTSSEVASLRMDLLLASATDGLPIVAELKVTSPGDGRPDKDPFFALIQALACASYLIPPQQMKRLLEHDRGRRLKIDDGRVNVYVLTVDEPPASKPWFELRDAAERLSAASISGLSRWVRTIAFLELAWLEKPSGGKRLPRATKRFAVSSMSFD
jgi:hypothetical protein